MTVQCVRVRRRCGAGSCAASQGRERVHFQFAAAAVPRAAPSCAGGAVGATNRATRAVAPKTRVNER
uniref:Uncharacterized protein n=1 Tax=viral metagenome TaxID=1070528 RepID=A0A6C0AUP0_9ZZZZ